MSKANSSSYPSMWLSYLVKLTEIFKTNWDVTYQSNLSVCQWVKSQKLTQDLIHPCDFYSANTAVIFKTNWDLSLLETSQSLSESNLKS